MMAGRCSAVRLLVFTSVFCDATSVLTVSSSERTCSTRHSQCARIPCSGPAEHPPQQSCRRRRRQGRGQTCDSRCFTSPLSDLRALTSFVCNLIVGAIDRLTCFLMMFRRSSICAWSMATLAVSGSIAIFAEAMNPTSPTSTNTWRATAGQSGPAKR